MTAIESTRAATTKTLRPLTAAVPMSTQARRRSRLVAMTCATLATSAEWTDSRTFGTDFTLRAGAVR